MENGFIKLHRKFRSWEWYDDTNTKVLFLHLILIVNWENKKWRGIEIKKGEIVTSLRNLANDTGLSIQETRTSLNKLKSTHEITHQSTSAYTKITLNKWEEYQSKEKNQHTKQHTKQQTSNKRSTTTKEYKEYKEDNNILQDKSCDQVNSIFQLFYKINPEVNFGNKTQRKIIENFIKKYGYEKLVGTIQYAVSVQGDKYAPTITNPLELKNKLGALILYEKKNKTQVTPIV